MVSKILRSLTKKFIYVVCAFKESNDLTTLSLDELHGNLLVHEQMMHNLQPKEQVLKVTQDDRMGASGGCEKGGHGRGRQFFNKSLIKGF